MTKKELLSKLDDGTRDMLAYLMAVYDWDMSQAAEYLYLKGYLAYWERDILQGH